MILAQAVACFQVFLHKRRRRPLGFAKKEAEAPPIDDGAQFAKRGRRPHRSTMAPKPRKAKAPTTYKGNDAACRVPLSQISMGPLSGWRKTRPGRLQELRASFLGGAFDQSTMWDVCLLRKPDEDENLIIDDGLATTIVNKWRRSPQRRKRD